MPCCAVPCRAVSPQLGPVQVFMATQQDGLRKPELGMWNFMVEHCNGGIAPGACVRRFALHTCVCDVVHVCDAVHVCSILYVCDVVHVCSILYVCDVVHVRNFMHARIL